MTAVKKQDFSKVMKSHNDDEMDFKWQSIKKIVKENKAKIGEKIAQWRKKNNIGVVQFCEMFGISTSQYYKLMDQEKNVSIMTLAEICQTLQIEFHISLVPIEKKKK